MVKCYLLLIFVVLWTTCRKAAVVTDNTLPRVEASMSLFDKVLKSSEEGWLVEATAKSGLRHIFWMKFNADGRVVMIADMREQSLKERESSYRLQQRQQPTLSFDSYNYISELADPDLSRGRGRGIDFEYAFSVALADSLRALEKSGSALTDIKRFELSGSTFGGKAVFTCGNKDPIKKIMSVIKVLDSLKPGGTNGKKHTVRIIKIGAKEYHYNFQSSLGYGNLYSRVLALTDLESKRGAVMSYYFDLEGNMRFTRAGSSVRVRTRDAALEEQVSGWVFDFGAQELKENITELKFAKNESGKEAVQGVFTSKNVTDIANRMTDQELDAYKLGMDDFYYFVGLEERWVKDITGLDGVFTIYHYLFEDETDSSLVVGNSEFRGRAAWWYKLIGNYKVEFQYNSYWTYRSLSGMPRLETAFITLGIRLGIPWKKEAYGTGTNVVFYILPTALGYELHHPEKWWVIPLYVR